MASAMGGLSGWVERLSLLVMRPVPDYLSVDGTLVTGRSTVDSMPRWRKNAAALLTA